MSTVQIINEAPTLFPTITICDSNAFTTKKAETLILNISQSYYGTDIANMSYSNYSLYVDNFLSHAVKSFVNDPKYGDENRKLLGFNLNKTLYSCSFTQLDCDLTMDFNWFFNYNFGNCYQFNSGLNNNLKNVSFGAEINGLSLVIGPLINQNRYPLTKSTGLKLFVHNRTSPPDIYSNWLSIESGKETSIVIDRTFSSNSPWPYSSCTDLSQGYNSNL